MSRISPWAIHRMLEGAVQDVDLRGAARNAGERLGAARRVAKYNKLVDERNQLADKAWKMALQIQEELGRHAAIKKEATRITQEAKAGLSKVYEITATRTGQQLNVFAKADVDAADENSDRRNGWGDHRTFGSLFAYVVGRMPVGMPHFNGIELAGYDNSFDGWRRAGVIWTWAMATSVQRATTHPIMAGRMTPAFSHLLEMSKGDGRHQSALSYFAMAMSHYSMGAASKAQEDWNVARLFFEMARNAVYENDHAIIPSSWNNPGLVHEDPMLYLLGCAGGNAGDESLFIDRDTAERIKAALEECARCAYGATFIGSINEARIAEASHFGVSLSGNDTPPAGSSINALPKVFGSNSDSRVRQTIPMRRSIIEGMEGVVRRAAGHFPKGEESYYEGLLKKAYEAWQEQVGEDDRPQAESSLITTM